MPEQTASMSAYGISLVLIADWFHPFLVALDTHAGAYGVILAATTYATNLYFKLTDRRRWKR